MADVDRKNKFTITKQRFKGFVTVTFVSYVKMFDRGNYIFDNPQ